jgi:lipopolysaccharide/colanic/teichoic acid biosynthesis glycosyltransferase
MLLQNRTPRSGAKMFSQPENALAVCGEEAEDSRYFRVKIVLDFLVATTLLVVTLPLILLCALLVKLTSSGPAIYSQVRLGRRGRPYTIYKLRTMTHNCELKTGVQWATADDPRITRLGKFLRKTHLDELPQLWNVVKGDMSLVGPRPERPEFIPSLEGAIPHYCHRLAVRPGVTGLAQIHLPPDTNLESVRRKLAYDLFYVRQASLWLDLRIIVCTAFQVVGTPVSFLRKLFVMPSVETIEGSYDDLLTTCGGSQVQPA